MDTIHINIEFDVEFITMFKSIINVVRGIDCVEYLGTLCTILSLPRSIVMHLSNVMFKVMWSIPILKVLEGFRV